MYGQTLPILPAGPHYLVFMSVKTSKRNPALIDSFDKSYVFRSFQALSVEFAYLAAGFADDLFTSSSVASWDRLPGEFLLLKAGGKLLTHVHSQLLWYQRAR